MAVHIFGEQNRAATYADALKATVKAVVVWVSKAPVEDKQKRSYFEGLMSVLRELIQPPWRNTFESAVRTVLRDVQEEARQKAKAAPAEDPPSGTV